VSDELRIERVIAARVEVVFAAFTSPRGQQALYGQDDPGWIVESACDLRVGGVWEVAFGPSRDEIWRHRHVFDVVDPPSRIVVKTTETRLDGSRFDFATEFVFQPHPDGTLMAMIQTGFPTAELRDEHGRGVPNALARLEREIRAGEGG
jgi:uncharacterized protein YndB with AHSA1/START domain